MENQQKQKRNLDFYANNSEQALEMKKSLEEKGYEVHHILSASPKPYLIDDKKNLYIGAGNIRINYGLF